MSKIRFDLACLASPGHTQYLKNRKLLPTVLTAKRLSDIVGRANMEKKRNILKAEEEELRYMNYLKDGNDALCRRFTHMGHLSLEEEKQAKLDHEAEEAAILDKQVKLEDEQMRKERVYRANRILENMKPGQKALNRARLHSEVLFQRSFNEALNREIANDAKRQQQLDEQLCPEVCIPYSVLTVEEEQKERKAKTLEYGKEVARDVEERRLRKLDEKEQQDFDVIVEREQYQCLHEMEKKAAKERAEKSRAFCQRAYQDSLKEKAQVEKYKSISEEVDDRTVCVDTVKKRHLNTDSAKAIKQQMAERIHRKEQLAIQLCRQQQAARRQAEMREQELVEQYEENALIDQARRECCQEQLVKERRAYELKQRKELELRRQRKAEIRRFQIAERIKNQKVNEHFETSKRAKKQEESKKLQRILSEQQNEFLERRQREQIRFASCQTDTSLQDDIQYFNDAHKSITAAQKTGRPIYPIVRAVESYRRENLIDSPDMRMLARNKLRDYCWPGYFSKAELAFKNYEHRNKCLYEQQRDRNRMLEKAMEIREMGAAESPFKKCEKERPMKLVQHRGLPALPSSDSFNCGREQCVPEDIFTAPLNSSVNVIDMHSSAYSEIKPKNSKQNLAQQSYSFCNSAGTSSCSNSDLDTVIRKASYSWL